MSRWACFLCCGRRGARRIGARRVKKKWLKASLSGRRPFPGPTYQRVPQAFPIVSKAPKNVSIAKTKPDLETPRKIPPNPQFLHLLPQLGVYTPQRRDLVTTSPFDFTWSGRKGNVVSDDVKKCFTSRYFSEFPQTCLLKIAGGADHSPYGFTVYLSYS